jgi:predicted house-cleaning noncanonical NTP pyrophosphatase (MazG superfamily)
MQQHPTPTKVSPGLHRPGLAPAPAPEPALHLLGGIWIASCMTCGYQLTTARAQERCERRAARRRCPTCRGEVMKLVRDRVPELAAGNGQQSTWHRADPVEYSRRLRDKLLEEAQEAAGARQAELLEELGDVLQVLYALATLAGYSPAEIECARARKARTHGTYTQAVVWHGPANREGLR